jgi:hypothetical protein
VEEVFFSFLNFGHVNSDSFFLGLFVVLVPFHQKRLRELWSNLGLNFYFYFIFKYFISFHMFLGNN